MEDSFALGHGMFRFLSCKSRFGFKIGLKPLLLMIFGNKELNFRSHFALLEFFGHVGVRRALSVCSVEHHSFDCAVFVLSLRKMVPIEVIEDLDDAATLVL